MVAVRSAFNFFEVFLQDLSCKGLGTLIVTFITKISENMQWYVRSWCILFVFIEPVIWLLIWMVCDSMPFNSDMRYYEVRTYTEVEVFVVGGWFVTVEDLFSWIKFWIRDRDMIRSYIDFVTTESNQSFYRFNQQLIQNELSFLADFLVWTSIEPTR